jgi:hypothetical protein
MKKTFLIMAAVVILVIGLMAQATAEVITFGSNYEFSGGIATPPASPTTPWLTTMFADNGLNSVLLTLAAPNLVGIEFVSAWYLNLEPDLNVASLVFGAPIINAGDFSNPSIYRLTDGYKANGDGFFDIRLDFANSDGIESRFTAGDSVSFIVTGAGLTANSFKARSEELNAPEYIGLYHAQHVQSIAPLNTSGWVSGPEITDIVPEPGSILAALSILGPAGLIFRRRQMA